MSNTTAHHPDKHYFNIAQYRSDCWYRLKEYAFRLEIKSSDKTAKTEVAEAFACLETLEQYYAYPGIPKLEELRKRFSAKEYAALAHDVSACVRSLVSDAYREQMSAEGDEDSAEAPGDLHLAKARPNYFEVLFADGFGAEESNQLHEQLTKLRGEADSFVYNAISAGTFQDAVMAVLFNPNIQAVVIRYGMPFASHKDLGNLQTFVQRLKDYPYSDRSEHELGLRLGAVLSDLRPELDLYYVTDTPVVDLDDEAVELFRRIFYRKEALQELHLTILSGIKERYETPFFSALMEYSQKPTGVFHAMPISRGNSVFKSRWIQDFGNFYGRNLFLAETSATTGGLDSLLQPTGTLKRAQEKASKAYGSRKTYFVTNGTSTANKIVQQALVRPDDVVLIDRDCHKSHHYGLVQSGAYPVYLDSYPVQEYSMYGAVPLSEIKNKLLLLRAAGRLDKVKMLLLTNCTFDGLVYNVERVMEEVLAIKPDMVFLWDEAWFAFAGFTHTYKQRTGMYVARKLYKKYKSASYRDTYNQMMASLTPGAVPTLPDPDKVRIRVYSTQSTHKTLSSMRQGSMIHIWDELFERKAEDAFHEAYMTHTSTSPNYQILASLDAGRRQVEFEGFEMVEKSVEMAMTLRSKVVNHPLLSKYFDVLTVKDFIPEKYRKSGIEEYYNPDIGWTRMEEAFASDEFVLDPTKVNLFIGKTGVDGDTFKNKYLMDQFGIQINKTSRNSVLFMTNIGTTRGSLAYLIGVLIKIARQLEDQFQSLNREELKILKRKIKSLTQEAPELPDFSHFHASFQAVPGVPGGNLREAFFLSYDDEKCEYLKLKPALKALEKGRELVSASFVIPYPPGFPILVPGQVVSEAILNFLIKLDVKEVHGYRPELGLRIFRESVLHRKKHATAMMAARKNSAHSPIQKPLKPTP
ncbi:MAG: ornithine decarboxylase [Cryomorphaceae bacterium]|nr:MAG: ornithine decarboxylase [Cryomorphaceae bacterium]